MSIGQRDRRKKVKLRNLVDNTKYIGYDRMAISHTLCNSSCPLNSLPIFKMSECPLARERHEKNSETQKRGR